MNTAIRGRWSALAAILTCAFAVIPLARSATPAGGDDAVVSIGHDATLAGGQTAESVVSIFGAATNAGHAGEVVSVLGSTHVTGSVDDSAVAVLGDTYINSTIGGDAVTVLGSMTLGPEADIGGDAVVVGGALHRDPAAIVRGHVQNVRIGLFGDFKWFHPWVEQCLLYARPLAVGPGLAWAWGVALFFLALYLLFTLLFRDGLMECVRTIETKPGRTVVAALLTILLMPIFLVLLCVTVIGIAAVPFVLLGLFCAALFGKAVILAWLGRLCLGRRDTGALGNPALAVLIGGAILLLLYIVPVAGFVAHQVFGLLGFGAVAYTLILKLRMWQTAGGGDRRAGSGSGSAAAGCARGRQRGSGRARAEPRGAAGDHRESAARGLLDPHGCAVPGRRTRRRSDRTRRHAQCRTLGIGHIRCRDVEVARLDGRRHGVSSSGRAPRRPGSRLGDGDRARIGLLPVARGRRPRVHLDRVR